MENQPPLFVTLARLFLVYAVVLFAFAVARHEGAFHTGYEEIRPSRQVVVEAR